MEQTKLPDLVSTKHGDMPGFVIAEEVPPKEDVDLKYHEAPQRQRQPGDPEVGTLGDALEEFKRQIPSALKMRNVLLKGARVGAIFEITGGVKVLVLYKREKYRFFSRHFPNAPGDGPGIIANLKLVHWAAMEGIKIATIFPDATCYLMDSMEFWMFYEKYGTEVSSLPGEIACPFEIWEKLF